MEFLGLNFRIVPESCSPKNCCTEHLDARYLILKIRFFRKKQKFFRWPEIYTFRKLNLLFIFYKYNLDFVLNDEKRILILNLQRYGPTYVTV